MKKLKIISILFLFITFLFVHHNNIVYCTEIKEIEITKVATSSSVDDILDNADRFVKNGESSIDSEELKGISNILYNLLLGIGIIAAVSVGIVLGMKYMIGSVDEKAELKQTLFAYLISCIVIFGAFGIWKLVVNILSSM